MKIRIKLLLSNLVVTLISISIGIFFIFQIISVQSLVNKEIPNAIQGISNESYLDSLAQFFRYYDEVLTMSARNYVFTGDVEWKNRYYLTAEDLDKKIIEAIAKGDDAEKNFFNKVDESNKALILLEEKSFALVESGNKQGAINILDGKEYEDLKSVYAGALTEYVNLRGSQYQDALAVSTLSVQNVITNISNSIANMIWVFVFGILLGVVVIFVFSWLFSKRFVAPINELKSTVEQIVSKNVYKKVDIRSNDEIGDLAKIFNHMNDNLRAERINLEKKVASRTKELETLNKYMVGRELKMIELKKQINDQNNK